MQDFITTLNQTNPDATYTQTGNTITGSWNTQQTASGMLGSQTIHMDYQVVVTLNPDNTYSYVEHMQAGNSGVGAGTDGEFGPTAMFDNLGGNQQQQDDGSVNIFNASSSTFSGKTFGNKQAGFEMQFGGKKGQNTIKYNFDASKIKDPLLQALQAAGYREQKKSFFGKLFGK